MKRSTKTNLQEQTHSNRLPGRLDLKDTESPETVPEATERGQHRARAKPCQSTEHWVYNVGQSPSGDEEASRHHKGCPETFTTSTDGSLFTDGDASSLVAFFTVKFTHRRNCSFKKSE